MDAIQPLGYLLDTTGRGIAIPTFSGPVLTLSPSAAGVFCAVFWAMVLAAIARRGAPYRWYSLMVAYSIAATLAGAGAARMGYAGLTPPVAFATATFAGAGIGLHLVAPVITALQPRFASPTPAGGGLLIGLPVVLSIMVFASGTIPAGTIILGSAVLGLPAALFAVNAGVLLGLDLRPRAAISLSLAGVPGELLAVALVPAFLRTL